MKGNINDSESGGSRAAKKRKKKKAQEEEKKRRRMANINEKSPLLQHEKIKDPSLIIEEAHHESINDSIHNGTQQSSLMNLPLGDDDDDHVDEKVELPPEETNKASTLKRKKKKSKKSRKEKSMDDIDETVVDVDELEDTAVLDSLIELNPVEILFFKNIEDMKQQSEDTEMNDEEGDESIELKELIEGLRSDQRARLVLNSILRPIGMKAEQFYDEYWEKQPLLISLNKNKAGDKKDPQDKATKDFSGKKNEGKVGSYVNWALDAHGAGDLQVKESGNNYKQRFDGLLSKTNIEALFSSQSVAYGRDVNVTNFCDTGDGEKRRITLDQLPSSNDQGDGSDPDYIMAESNDIWANYSSGCTIRLLCPQKYNDQVHALLSTLEDEFGCMVGANAYLTPGGCQNQGFAPHYDDIDAFILQLEGYKHWKVYEPFSKQETLPRESSRDFTEEEMKGRDPVIEVDLGPGDVLYMPRGWIHHANTIGNHHSLHLTASAMQNWAWVDLLELIMPEALHAAAESETSTSLRSGLPRKFLKYMGAMYDQSTEDINQLPEGLKQLSEKLNNDEGSNNHGETSDNDEDFASVKRQRIQLQQQAFQAEAKKKIMRVCKEAISMVTAACDQIGKRFLSDRLPPYLIAPTAALTSEKREMNGGKIWPNTLCRLAKPGIARLVLEDDKAILYHSADNSRVYHESPLSPLEFEKDDGPALEMLLTTIEPHWICVSDLIHEDIEDKMEVAQSLYDEGILAIFQQEKE